MEMYLAVIATAFGLIVGSFINVVILRLPEGKNITWDRSACRKCSRQLAWYENIPVLSYLFLLGRCRTCKECISIQYPLVEIVHGVAGYVLLKDWASLDVQTGIYQLSIFFIVSILIAHFVIDLRHQLLLDKLNIALLLPVIVLIIIDESYIRALTGGTFGFSLPLAVTWIFYKVTGKIGLGGGDIKLFGVIGLMFGIQGVLLNLFTSCMLGSFITIFLIMFKIVRRDQFIPFGPYIILVTFTQIFFPNLMEQWKTLLFPY